MTVAKVPEAPSTGPKTQPTRRKLSRDDEVLVAVMGATGSGKSTFINLASRSNLAIGSGLHSCTNAVQVAPPFELHGRSVTLIDTPGFDDTSMSDTDILKIIAVFLSSTYERGTTLTGIIYMHRISDVRMGGVARKNFRLFRELCGISVLSNVILVTNMWSNVDAAVGNAREAELRTDDLFFKPVLDKGARLLRHTNTSRSAQTVLGAFLDLQPAALQIQRELVDQGMDISQTAAGAAIGRDLQDQIAQLRQDVEDVDASMQVAVLEWDQDAQKELQEDSQALQENIAGLEKKWQVLAIEFEQQKGQMDENLDANAEQAKRRAEREEARHEREVKALEEELAQEKRTFVKEREALQRQIDEIRLVQGSVTYKASEKKTGEKTTGESARSNSEHAGLPDFATLLAATEKRLKKLEADFARFKKGIHDEINKREEEYRKTQQTYSGFWANAGWALDEWFKSVGEVIGHVFSWFGK